MATIAGHRFGPDGHCEFSVADGTRSCGKTFADIASATKEDINKEGWAHTGKLSATEYQEIDTQREKIWIAHSGQSKMAKAV